MARLSSVEATLVSFFALAFAIQYNDGTLSRVSLLFLTVALVMAPVGLSNRGSRLRWPLVYLIIAWEFIALWFARPCIGLPATSMKYRAGILVCGLAAATMCLARTNRWRRAGFGIAVAAVFVVGVWILRTIPAPPIDTYVFHQDGSAALFSGINPYTIRFPDIYNAEDSQRVYGPGISVNGRLTFGFPYPPLSLFLSSLGYLIAGDCRYAHLAAICGAAVLLAFARPSRLSFAAALALLFTPRIFYIVTMSWTEPVIIFLFASLVFCYCRMPRLAPWVAGLFLASKQYLALLTPLVLRKWQDVPKAAIAGSVVTLPLALWNFSEFWISVVQVQLKQPLRLDALSYMSELARYGITLPVWVPFVLGVAAVVFALRKGMPSPSARCSAIGFVLLLFFAFNKQAFCNYYFLVIGVLASSAATADVKDSETDRPVNG